MSIFSRRSKGYKVGVFLLAFAFSVFFVGYVAPYWKTLHSAEGFGHQSFDEGLWMYCVSEDHNDGVCVYAATRGKEAWFQAVRALEGFSFLGLMLSCVYAVRINCWHIVSSPRTRFLEIMAAVSGLLGFTGCMLYFAYLSSGERHMVLYKDNHHVISSGAYTSFFNWAFYMTSAGNALGVLAATIVFIYNRELPLVSPTMTLSGSKGGCSSAIIAITTFPPPQGQGSNGQQPGYGYSYGYGYPATFEPVKPDY